MVTVFHAFLLLALVAVAGCGGRSGGATPAAAMNTVAAAPSEEPVELAVAGGTLHGTLLVPGGTGPFPVALVIAGSGPTDRDGNSPLLPGRNDSLKLLAEGLAERGVATLRFDKRGIAASAAAGPSEADLRFGTYVDDAVAWVGKLRSDARFSSVAIIGHSEGSLVGILAAGRTGVDAFVSIAGTARPAADLLREQLRPQLPANLWQESERILASLEEGRTVDQVPSELLALYRPSVQPYMISWLPLDPAAAIGRIESPVLVVQGTTDIQVTVEDGRALHAAHPGAELAIIEGMNHILKLVPADAMRQQASYADPSLPVAPELIDRVSTFLVSAAR